MNTLEQPLRHSHEDLMIEGPLISRGAPRTRRTARTQFARRRHWEFLGLVLVMYLGGIALLFHLLRSALGNPPLTRQEFEGLGIVLGALAFIGVFLWRLSRALERETQQVEASEKPSEIPSTVVRRMQTGE